MRSDPVCKMEVDEKTTMNKAFYRGKDYYFCSAGCQSQFQTNPESFGEHGATNEQQPSSARSMGTERGSFSEQSSEAVGKAKSMAHDMKERAKEQSKSVFDRTKMSAAGRLDDTSRTFRQTAENLQKESPTVSKVAERVADKIEEASHYLRGKEAGEILQDVERLIRSQPVLMFAAAFAMGVMMARFLKSSREQAGTY